MKPGQKRCDCGQVFACAKKACPVCGKTYIRKQKPQHAHFGWVKPDPGDLSAHYNLGINRKKLSAETQSQIITMVKDGVSPGRVASVLCLRRRDVETTLYHKRMQRQMEMPQYEPDPKYNLAQEMWQDGSTIAEIAEAYGMPGRRMGGVIERYRKSFGLFPNRHTKPRPKLSYEQKPTGQIIQKIIDYFNTTGNKATRVIVIARAIGLDAKIIHTLLRRNQQLFNFNDLDKTWRINNEDY